MRRLAHTVPLLCLTRIPALAKFTGSVVSLLDSDTTEVLHDQRPKRIRLNVIDWPEKGQPYGKA
ncbi:MAG: hypothetical protein ACT4O4_07705 [Nitrospiraceae bacterium]